MSQERDLSPIKAYFARCIEEHGTSPRGVDWNSAASQEARFDELLRVVKGDGPFSIMDYGCGYGALSDYLEKKGMKADYVGYDMLEEAIKLARETHKGKPNRSFFSDSAALPQVDYVVASGVFNLRGEASFEDWTAFVVESLGHCDRLSRKGFASTFLTKYSDADRMRGDLYYADPGYLFDYAKRHWSRNVAILHDYDVYDFTLIVRKNG